MKNFNLNKYDVQEMNAGEMVNINGGTIGEFLASIWNWLVGHSTGSGISVDID